MNFAFEFSPYIIHKCITQNIVKLLVGLDIFDESTIERFQQVGERSDADGAGLYYESRQRVDERYRFTAAWYRSGVGISGCLLASAAVAVMALVAGS